MPQAPGPCWGCLSVSPEPAGPAQCGFVTTPRQLETSWEPLICSAPAMIHQRSPTYVGRRQTWPNPLSRHQKLGTRGGFLLATDARPVSGSRPLQQTTGFSYPSAGLLRRMFSHQRANGEELCVPVATTQIDSQKALSKSWKSSSNVPSPDRSIRRLLQIGRAPPPMGAYRTPPPPHGAGTNPE